MDTITLSRPVQQGRSAPLGTPAISASISPEGGSNHRLFLQSGARSLLGGERVAHCLRTPIRSSVDILYSPTNKRAIYRGLQTCGSVWMCPVCAARISEHRRKELGAAVAEWRAKGGRVIMVTYTIRHKASDNLSASVDGLLSARRLLRSGSSGQGFISRFGVIGSVRALEVTHGAQNGWHPHIHELLFVEEGCDTEALEAYLRERWDKVLSTAGLREVNEHGIKVQDTDQAVADYIAKFGKDPNWTEAHELSKQVVKKGRGEGRAPMGLLEDYCRGDEEAGELFKAYAYAMKGRHQLVWSPGLRDYLLPWLKDEKDEDIVGDVSEYPEVMATLSLEEWRTIVGNDARGELLDIAAEGDAGKVSDFIILLMMNSPTAGQQQRTVPTWRDFVPRAILEGVRGDSYLEGVGTGEDRNGIRPFDPSPVGVVPMFGVKSCFERTVRN